MPGPGGPMPARMTHESLAVHPGEGGAALFAGPFRHGRNGFRAVAEGRAADDHQRVGARVPVQRGRPGRQRTLVLAPHDAVDDGGLDPGVPGAAVLGGGRVDGRRGEGDLAAVPDAASRAARLPRPRRRPAPATGPPRP